MIYINLLPVRAAQKKEKLREQMVILAISLLLVAGVCGAVYSVLLGKISDEKREIQKKEQEIARLQKDIGEVGRFKKLQQELRGKLDILEKLTAGKTGPVHLLEGLSGAVPEKLWVESFKEEKGVVTLSGIGLNEETIAEFLQKLEISPYFENVELKVVDQFMKSKIKLHKFQITCRVEVPGNVSSPK